MGRARWGALIASASLWLACASEDGSLFGAVCAEGLTDCGGACVDLDQDAAHCGGCNQACPPGEACVAGTCGAACPADQIDCDGSCVDPTSDPRHCGGCGQPCLTDEQCLDSTCQCEDGWTDCDGACVDLSSDASHCGSCDEICQPTEQCTGSACVGTCVLPAILCGAECIDPQAIDIGSAVPQTIDGNTVGAVDQLAPSCHEGGPEKVYLFTAPASGSYVFEANAILSVRSLDCAELACVSGSEDAATHLSLTAGEQVLVIVEGSDDPISYTLRVLPWPDCPEIPLGSEVPLVVPVDAVVDSESLSCALESGTDRTYSFAAPATDDYLFLVEPAGGIPHRPTIEVRAASCNGGVLGCGTSDNAEFQAAQAIVSLTQGQPVVLAVDTGLYVDTVTLYVDVVPPCPEHDLGSTVPQTVNGTLQGQPSLLVSSCLPDGFAQVSYGFTAPADGDYMFDIWGPVMPYLEVRDGDCDGAQLACADPLIQLPPFDLPLSQGQHVAIIVSHEDSPQDFGLSIEMM